MIDHSTLDAIHDGLRRLVMRDIVIDDILTHHTAGSRPVACGYVVMFHSSDGPRCAYFTSAQVVDGRGPEWCMMLRGSP